MPNLKNKLENWCLRLIDDFREEYLTLTDVQKKNIIPCLAYCDPCQIEIFWISEPIEYQLLILLHDSERKDKEIVINGPYRGSDFFESLYEIMEKPNWKRKYPCGIDDSHNIYGNLDFGGDVGDQEGKYSDYILPYLANLVLTMEYDPFSMIKFGPSGSRSIGNKDWCILIKGNILDLNVDQYDRFNPIISIKNTVFPEGNIEKKQPPLILEKEKPQSNTIIGTYFYPNVRIGDDIELSFKEKFINSIGMPEIIPKVENEFVLGKLWGFYDTYGFFGIQTENKSEVIEILNVIFGVSNILGYEATPIRIRDLVITNLYGENKNLGGFEWSTSDFGNQKPFSPPKQRKVKISLENIRKILNISQIALINNSLKDKINYFLESSTHFNNEEYQQSFIFSWLIVESYISELFDDMLLSKEVNRERRKKFSTQDKWSMDSKIEVLEVMDYISKKEYDFLSEYNKKRNKLVHTGEIVSKEDANDVLLHGLDLIKRILDQENITNKF